MKQSTPRIGALILAIAGGFVAAAVAMAGALVVAAIWLRPADPTLPAIPVTFNLSDQSGAAVSERDFAGRHLLVSFGFTNCPDICPTQMSKLSTAMAKLEQSGHATEVTPVFISVDPERDSPERVTRFLARYDERFVGLTGSRPAIAEAAASFKTYLQEAPPPGITDYDVIHATTVYIVDPHSRIVGYVPGSEDADAIATRIRTSLG